MSLKIVYCWIFFFEKKKSGKAPVTNEKSKQEGVSNKLIQAGIPRQPKRTNLDARACAHTHTHKKKRKEKTAKEAMGLLIER